MIMRTYFYRIQNGDVHLWSVIVQNLQPPYVAAIAIKVIVMTFMHNRNECTTLGEVCSRNNLGHHVNIST